jgi:hypothetical protein
MNVQRRAGGGLIRDLIEGVAKEAPGLERGAASSGRRVVINIGLDINGGERLAPRAALAALERAGVRPLSAKIAQSDREPTLIVELDRSLHPHEAHALSESLQQEAIAQVDEHGVGELHGPGADKWRPFNGDYFIDPSGKRLTQSIMEAGDPSNAPGGADPVLQRLEDLSAQLSGHPVKKGGGGLIEDAAKMLINAAEHGEARTANTMRLYHGRSFREPIKQLDPLISWNQLGIHLGDPETAGKFATIRDNVRPKDAGARVIPLDVKMQNPIRLRDNAGHWEPAHVYNQLVEQGKVPFDRETQSRLYWGGKGYSADEQGTMYEDDLAQTHAMLEVQDMIRGLGHDGVVYKNRYEFPDNASQSRAERRSRDELNSLSDEEFATQFPEARDSHIAFRKEQLKSPFGDGPGVGYAGGGLVDLLDFSEVHQPRRYGDGGAVSPEDAASMSHWDSYGTGKKPAYLETMGTKIPLGDGNFYANPDGSTYEPRSEGPQALHDGARMGLYALPGAGPFIGTALDTTEAALTGSPGEAAAALVMGPTGKKVKAIASAIGAATAGAGDADAGVFGRAAKWAMGGEGKDALNAAIKMSSKGADNGSIFASTGWFKDYDGHWKFWRPSTGGGLIEPLRGNKMGDVLRDPHTFEQYPDLADIGFRRKNQNGAHWDAPNNEIVLGDTSSPWFQEPKQGGKYGSLLHELYHAKASKEGWANGMSANNANSEVIKDINRFHGMKNADPSVAALADAMMQLSPRAGEGLPYKRYSAEVGEALARREAGMREYRPDNLKGITPAHQSTLDLPDSALFHPGEIATPDKYRELFKMLTNEQIAADMEAAAAAKPKIKGRR